MSDVFRIHQLIAATFARKAQARLRPSTHNGYAGALHDLQRPGGTP